MQAKRQVLRDSGFWRRKAGPSVLGRDGPFVCRSQRGPEGSSSRKEFWGHYLEKMNLRNVRCQEIEASIYRAGCLEALGAEMPAVMERALG